MERQSPGGGDRIDVTGLTFGDVADIRNRVVTFGIRGGVKVVAGGGVEQTVQGYGASGLRRERETRDFLIAIATGDGVVPFPLGTESRAQVIMKGGLGSL